MSNPVIVAYPKEIKPVLHELEMDLRKAMFPEQERDFLKQKEYLEHIKSIPQGGK